MVKNLIVGTGFAGMVAYLLLDKDALVFGSDGKIKPQHQNSSFRYNKILGLKAGSYTKLENKLLNTKIHDRLIQGGNGTIWGGFFNANAIPDEQLAVLRVEEILLVPLSFAQTGSISANKEIFQLQDLDAKILNPADVVKDIIPAYLESFKVLNDGSLELNIYKSDGVLKASLERFTCKRLILSIGVVQLIDLLYRSNFIKENDILELTEFKYRLALRLRGAHFAKDSQIIRFNFLRGLLHYFGIQRYPRIISFVDRLIPFVFEQSFSWKNMSNSFVIKQGALFELRNSKNLKFGLSIHYCNLKINGVSVSDFLESLSGSIIGLGMAFVDQQMPGPISNDIFIDAIKKIQREK